MICFNPGKCDAICRSDTALENCWGFIDGTMRSVGRPGENQRAIYNEHKRVHSVKFQSVALPNGLVSHLYGPVEGKRNDSGMLTLSGLLQDLQRFSISPVTGLPMCVYGDRGYPVRAHLQGHYKGEVLTIHQREFNKSMNSAHVSFEWVFNDIFNCFQFFDFKKNLKVGLSAVGKMYIVCFLMQNAHTILYGSLT